MTGIVIINYNNITDIRNCIDSIIKYVNIAEVKIVVVDNGSNEDVRTAVRDHISSKFTDSCTVIEGSRVMSATLSLSTITYLMLPTNIGYARGNNAGIELLLKDDSISEIMILNSDIILTEDILGPLKNIIAHRDDVGAVSPLLRKPNGEVDYCCARRALERKSMLFTFSFMRRKHYRRALESRKLLKQYPELINENEVTIDLPSGSCMMFKRPVMQKLGGFDEGTFLYYEEDILNKKIKFLGLKNILVPQVSCIHIGGATTNNTKSAYFLKKCNYDSLLYYLQKYESCSKMEMAYYKLSGNLCLLRLWLGKLYHSILK